MSNTNKNPSKPNAENIQTNGDNVTAVDPGTTSTSTLNTEPDRLFAVGSEGRAGYVVERIQIDGDGNSTKTFNVTPKVECVVNYMTFFRDEYAGSRRVETIFEEKPNYELIARNCADRAVRKEVSDFFCSRAIAELLADQELIPTPMVRTGEVLLIKADVVNHIQKKGQNISTNAAMVIAEILIPILIKCKIIVQNARYTTIMNYGFEEVTIDTIKNYVLAADILRVMENSVRIPDLSADKKMARRVFASEIADSLVKIGVAMRDIQWYGAIVDDILCAIRCRLQPDHTDLSGNVPEWFLNDESVERLADNQVFIDAALKLGTNLNIVTSHTKLQQYSSLVLTAITQSPRWKMVSRSEIVSYWNSKKIRNPQGLPVSVIAYHNAAPLAVSQAITTARDSANPFSVTIMPINSAITDYISSGYGDSNAMSVAAAVRPLFEQSRSRAELELPLPLASFFGVSEYMPYTVNQLVCCLSERTSVSFDPITGAFETDSVTGDLMRWWRIPTTEHDFSWGLSGVHEGNFYFTYDAAEAVLAFDELNGGKQVPAPNQLLDKTIYDTRTIGIEKVTRITLDKCRFSFSQNILGANIHGSFKASELGVLRSTGFAEFVVPAYNEMIFRNLRYMVETMLASCDKVVRNDPAHGSLIPTFKRQIARYCIDLVRAVNPAFRREIHSLMVLRSLKDRSYTDQVRMRSIMSQSLFGAYADFYAFHVFLTIQGILHGGQDGQVDDFWIRLLNDPEIRSYVLEVESDRRSLGIL